jgi:hypothetical protein
MSKLEIALTSMGELYIHILPSYFFIKLLSDVHVHSGAIDVRTVDVRQGMETS